MPTDQREGTLNFRARLFDHAVLDHPFPPAAAERLVLFSVPQSHHIIENGR
jgi:hypothetical protein